MPSLETLTKVAICGGFLVGAAGYAGRFGFESRIRKTITYKKALELFYSHDKTIEHLGQPIEEGRIDFDLSEQDDRKFSVKVKGSKTRGNLNCEYKILPDLKTEIQKLEIKFNDIPNKVFVIHEV